jgi:RNA polymerase sigma-70 factor (ECF subfamily)
MAVPRSGTRVTFSAPDSDVDLLRRIALRDEAALAALYDRHSRLAYSLIVRILRNTSDAEEVLQETFVRVWSRADTYEPRLGTPSAWLLRIARNRAIDRLRAIRTRAHTSESNQAGDGDAVPMRPEPVTRDTPEAALQVNVVAVAVRAAMADLSSSQRELIEAAFFDGYTHQELAARFRVPLGTVKTRIRAGLTALRGRLEQTV